MTVQRDEELVPASIWTVRAATDVQNLQQLPTLTLELVRECAQQLAQAQRVEVRASALLDESVLRELID
jgi:predicted metallopeptidase